MIPARGRKRLVLLPLIALAKIVLRLDPREGTETRLHHLSRELMIHVLRLDPREGTETLILGLTLIGLISESIET